MSLRKFSKKGLVEIMVASTVLCLANPLPVDAASWKKNNVGWWYQEDNGSWPANTWKKIKGSWYWFDQNGYMATGWRLIGGNWYYMQPSGTMLEQGWHWIGDKCYYMYASGEMASNTWIDNYYVDSSGKWIPDQTQAGWIQNGNRWWYRHSNGSYTRNGWEKINGQWYYFDNAGWMVANQWVGDYYVTASGAMATNTWIGNYYVDDSGKWIPNAQNNQHTHNWIEKKYEEVGHWENTLIKEAWDETVSHEAEGYYEKQKVQVGTKPLYEKQLHGFCYTCNKDIGLYMDPVEGGLSKDFAAHLEYHRQKGETHFTLGPVNVDVQVGEEPVYEENDIWIETKPARDEVVHHDAIFEKQWKIDRAAYTEIICSGCGEKKR